MKLIWAFIILVIVAFGVIGAAGYWWQQQILPAGSTAQVAFVIPKNQIAAVTVQQLQDQHLIRSALTARIYLKVSGLGQKIQNGTFIINPGGNMVQVLETLTRAPKDIWVTIPEGWRREQIADRFAAELAGPGTAFSKNEFLAGTVNLEGQLFPDTYLVPRSSTAADIKKYLLDNFTKKVGPVDSKILILASLVEREGKTQEDRPVIAGILAKRLAAGWALQVDATLQYFQGQEADWWPKQVDTKLASPYNTYLHPGLPPTPICNPGLAAIQAALQPTASNYWYYLHDKNGMAHYATTLAEHNSNIDKYLNP